MGSFVVTMGPPSVQCFSCFWPRLPKITHLGCRLPRNVFAAWTTLCSTNSTFSSWFLCFPRILKFPTRSPWLKMFLPSSVRPSIHWLTCWPGPFLRVWTHSSWKSISQTRTSRWAFPGGQCASWLQSLDLVFGLFCLSCNSMGDSMGSHESNLDQSHTRQCLTHYTLSPAPEIFHNLQKLGVWEWYGLDLVVHRC